MSHMFKIRHSNSTPEFGTPKGTLPHFYKSLISGTYATQKNSVTIVVIKQTHL
jgi:hypothetical protein